MDLTKGSREETHQVRMMLYFGAKRIRARWIFITKWFLSMVTCEGVESGDGCLLLTLHNQLTRT